MCFGMISVSDLWPITSTNISKATGNQSQWHCHINLAEAQDWQRFDDQLFRAATLSPLNAPAHNFFDKDRLMSWHWPSKWL